MMVRSLFLLFISGLIGVVMNPGVLTAADMVNVTRVSDAKAVETVVLPEPEPEPVAVAKAPVAGYAPAYVAPANNIQIAGRTLEVVTVGSTTVDARNHVNRYGSRFLYGHNSAGVFGGLTSMGAGSVFAVTNGGVTTNYRVANVVIFEKNGDLLQLNGTGNFMGAVASGIHMGVQYDLAVMTCYGTSYGNGDASHRYVVFANAI